MKVGFKSPVRDWESQRRSVYQMKAPNGKALDEGNCTEATQGGATQGGEEACDVTELERLVGSKTQGLNAEKSHQICEATNRNVYDQRKASALSAPRPDRSGE